MLYGAIIGDIVGSRYEGYDHKSKDFEFFHEADRFTDDTVMTLAVYEACKQTREKKFILPSQAEKLFADSMRKWGREYGGRGYGDRFFNWLINEDAKAYNSWGNGSAMRVSAVGWMFDSLRKVEKYAKLSAMPTHDHPEGIKGAQAIAGAVFIARKTCSKDVVKKYVERFGYELLSCDEVRPEYRFDVSCQGTVPVAVEAFLESESFEDAVRIAVSMGGDSDTIAAITGSIAEAYYGVPDEFKTRCLDYLDDKIREILTETNV